MTSKVSSGRGKKIVKSGTVSAIKKGRATQVKRAGERSNALRKVARRKAS